MKTDEIIKQLEKINSSRIFARSPILSGFLSYVVNQTLSGKSTFLKEYCIAIEALGKNEDFDPQKSSIVRTSANRLRNALESYYALEGRDDDIRIELPRGSYIPLFKPGISLEPATEKKVDKGQGDHAGIPAICIAVVPFECFSDSLYSLGNLLGKQLCAGLAAFKDLNVISWCMVKEFQDQNVPDNAVCIKFKAHHILNGTIHINRNRVTIHIILVNCNTGHQVWQKSFDGEFSEEGENKLVIEVVEITCGSVGGFAGVITREQFSAPNLIAGNPVYMAIVTYAKAFQNTPTLKLIENATQVLNTAIEYAPEKSFLRAMLAECYITGYVFGFYTKKQSMSLAQEQISRALMIDDNDQYTRCISGFYYSQNGFHNLAMQEIKTALALNPNDVFIAGRCAHGIAVLGDLDYGLAVLERGRNLNPYFIKYNYLPYFLNCIRHNEYDKAMETAQLYYIPDFFWSPLLLAVACYYLDRVAEARMEYENILQMKSDFDERREFYVGCFVIPEDLRAKLLTALEVIREQVTDF